MDYNYFAGTHSRSQSQPTQLFSYGDGIAALTQSLDANSPTQFAVGALTGESLLPSTIPYMSHTLTYDSSMLNLHTGFQATPEALALLQLKSIDSSVGMDFDTDTWRARRDSSEEKDPMTPAQSRRKAQNRAAQRAFRERKERHLRDLEAKLNLLTTTTSALQSDNDRLKALLRRVQTENERLRARAATSPQSKSFSSASDSQKSQPSRTHLTASSTSEGTRSSSTALGSSLSRDESADRPEQQSQLMSASATWDFLQAHPKHTSGVVDMRKVCEKLKKLARCNGAGPMFDKDEVKQIIDETESNGADEL